MGVPSGDLQCFFEFHWSKQWKRSKRRMSMSKCKTLEKIALEPLIFRPHIFLNSFLFWEIKNIWVCQPELYNPSLNYWGNWTMSKDFKLSKSWSVQTLTYHLDAVNSRWAHRVGRVHNPPHSKCLYLLCSSSCVALWHIQKLWWLLEFFMFFGGCEVWVAFTSNCAFRDCGVIDIETWSRI